MTATGDDDITDGPPPRPSPPKRKRESVVIEGSASKAGPLGAPAAAPRGALAVGALGGALATALALAGVWLLAPRFGASPAAGLEDRVTALEAQAKTLKTPKAAPDAEARLAAGEAALRDLQASAEAQKRALAGAAARLKAVSDAEAAFEARLTSRAEAPAAAPRLDRLAAPQPAAGDGGAARAIAAMALRSRLNAGEPLGPALAALDRLGVAAEALAPLRAYAETGAPTELALARALDQAPSVAASPASGGVAQRLLGEVQGLVKVRKLGDGPAPATDMSPVATALAAGDLAGALAAFAALPPATQTAARNWRESAEARLAAGQAANALVEGAVAELGVGR